nr:hypothetical protein [Tanacetum cinerariifolium]
MTSFGYRLNPRYAIKECLSCGALYIKNCSSLKGSVEDKILAPKLPEKCARCAKCGHLVNGPYCQGCSLLREKLEEDLVTYLKYFQDTFESSDDSTNVVNAPREPFVVKQDHGVKSSQNLSHIDKCFCECGEALDGIFCQQCICKSCGKEPPIYSCEFYGSNAQYGHYCTPQAPFNNPELGYSQDLNFSQNIHNFQQQPTHLTRVMILTIPVLTNLVFLTHNNIFVVKICQPPKYIVNHPIFNAHNDFLNSQNELFTSQNTIMEQMTQLTSMCEMVCQIFQKKQEEKRIEEEQAASARYWKIPACCDDDDDYDYAITPKETDNSLSMGDEHLDIIPAPCSNPNDDDSLYKENIEYVEASPHNSELISLEVAEIVIPAEEEIKDDNLREKLLNVHLLITNIEALKDNPNPSSEFLTKSSSTFPKS